MIIKFLLTKHYNVCDNVKYIRGIKMRVITGIARGKRIISLEGEAVRPTSQKVKEAVFSSIQFDIEGRKFLDLFAGCGQMGIEALSRGAESAVFIDKSQQSISVVKQNIASCGFEKDGIVFKSEYSDFLSNTKLKFDIAFLDPPYRIGILNDALEKTTKVMSEAGVIICEHPLDVKLPNETNGFRVTKSYKYGKVLITVYRKNV